MPHDVFISYSTQDKEVVEKITTFLEQNAVRCWIAYRDIPVGRDWADFIPQAIEDCKLMIYVHSSRSNPSKEIDKEIALSLENKHPILPFKIEDVRYSGSKAYHLATINWIDAFPNPEKCFGRLLTNVQRILKDIETGVNPEETKKNIEYQVDSEKDNKKIKKIPNYLWFGLAGIVAFFFLVFGILKYNNSAKMKSDVQTYNELVVQAEEDFSKGEDYYAAALGNYKKAFDYEQQYINSKHADKFGLETENKISELETAINNLINDYKSKAEVFEDCDEVICLEELIFYYNKLTDLQPDNQEIKTKWENYEHLLSQHK